MAFRMRFRRRVRLAPGISLDLNKRSAGLTLGPRGAHVTLNSKGDLTKTVGIPGSGLSWQERERVGSDDSGDQSSGQSSEQPEGRHCTECGAAMKKSDEFCPQCGTFFGAEQ